jgi:2-polyprenyl-3-methyl-5-hydroxy-6-metoxy-1,4-benzoquinol methylase
VIDRSNKCCSHRPVAGRPWRCFLRHRGRPTGPWLQWLDFYLSVIKKLFSISAMIVLAWTCLYAQPAATPPESAANKFMHHSDFKDLLTHFEDPARAQWQKPDEVIASLGPLDGKTVADIGAGTGYFTFPIAKKAAKVLAIDIDQRFLDYIEQKKRTQKVGANVETRITAPDSPGLKPGEADVVLIVDTFHHIENRVEYLKKLKGTLNKGGVLVIVDFKKEKTPPGPPVELRLAQESVESELKSAGFTVVSTDRALLPYQYIIKAK